MPRPGPRHPLARPRALFALPLLSALFWGPTGNGAENRLPTRVAADDAVVDPRATAARIDRLLADHWRARGIRPAGPVDDAEFLRRVTLDLVGRPPLPAE